MKDKLKQIEIDEWLFCGCFIQKQNHPNLLPYFIFKNTKEQEHCGVCFTMTEAKKIAKLNKVEKEYLIF